MHVAWEMLSETNSYRFYLQRKKSAWVIGDSVNGAGTVLALRHYELTDSSVQPGTWTYRIKQRDLDGSVHYSQAATVALSPAASDQPVAAFMLEQNFPNSFNPSTTIRSALPQNAYVTLSVYNALGQLVSTLVDGEEDAGFHQASFNGLGLASGVYFYRLRAGSFVRTRALSLVR